MNPNDTKPVRTEPNTQPIPLKPDTQPSGTAVNRPAGPVADGAAGALTGAPAVENSTRVVNPA